MTDKTLGQVAYERFWELSPFADEAPSNWAGRGEVSQAAWQAAAEAVVKEWVEDTRTTWPQQQAVIEAAKVWCREHYPEQYEALHQAVDALQEVESGK